MACKTVLSNDIPEIISKYRKKEKARKKLSKKCKQQLKPIFQMNFWRLFYNGL